MEGHEQAVIDGARALAPVIRECRDEMERARRLPGALVDAMAAAGVFAAYVPRELGGLEIRPRAFLEMVEAIAREDGSAGWNAAICGVSGVYLSRLDPTEAREVLDGGFHGVAGSFNPAQGRMAGRDGGYVVSGRWGFASGCDGAAWMMAPGMLFEAGEPIRDDGGNVRTRIALLPKERCEIIDTWDVGGMRATGSHDFALADHYVPGEYTFAPGDPGKYRGPLYRIPILTAFGPGVAGTCLGIARGAITELARLAAEKRPLMSRALLRERPAVQLQMAEAEALVQSARLLLVAAIDGMWAEALAGHAPPSLDARLRQRLAAWNAARSALRATRLMYEAAGTTAVYSSSPLDRALRDVTVATQHATVSAAAQETVGRVLLGLEPNTPLV